MIRYELIICWSDEDQGFAAEISELPGCAADGATYQEALAMALTTLALEVGNPARPEVTEKLEFLIDSGAIYSVISAPVSVNPHE